MDTELIINVANKKITFIDTCISYFHVGRLSMNEYVRRVSYRNTPAQISYASST